MGGGDPVLYVRKRKSAWCFDLLIRFGTIITFYNHWLLGNKIAPPIISKKNVYYRRIETNSQESQSRGQTLNYSYFIVDLLNIWLALKNYAISFSHTASGTTSCGLEARRMNIKHRSGDSSLRIHLDAIYLYDKCIHVLETFKTNTNILSKGTHIIHVSTKKVLFVI